MALKSQKIHEFLPFDNSTFFCKEIVDFHDRFGVKKPEVQIIYTIAGSKHKKQKQIRNISGFRNQAKASPAPSASSQHPTLPWSRASSPEDDGDESDLEDDDEDLDLLIHFDSLKINFQHEDEHEKLDENDEGEK